MFNEMIGKLVTIRIKDSFESPMADYTIDGVLLEADENFVKIKTRSKEKRGIIRSEICVINKMFIKYVSIDIEEEI